MTVGDRRVWTHVRLNIYPDGGVARLRVYGVAHFDWSLVPPGEWVDLAAMSRGGRALACNDMHFGHMSNLIAPGHGLNMGDGWETRRRRNPGNDWVILKLGPHPARGSGYGLLQRQLPGALLCPWGHVQGCAGR